MSRKSTDERPRAGTPGAGSPPWLLPAVAGLVALSGCCALIYQVAWIRAFRLMFGATTAASGAVLAVFMGGLGVGSLVLGRRVDRLADPLAFYARLELVVAAAAAASPLLLVVARELYLRTGGTGALGDLLATLVRLLLAAVVLGVPTFAMGGTLPAAARAVEAPEDVARRRTALLYGATTAGAVVGALLCTFVLLEQAGQTATLVLAALLNAGAALAAARLAARVGGPAAAGPGPAPRPAAAPAWFVVGAAAASGFACFLLELVWFRMLGALLGGTTYTFGLVLALVLAGIGLGGAARAAGGSARAPTLGGFAFVSALGAVAVLAPLALGDSVALLGMKVAALRPLGFAFLVVGWALVAALVVLPASLVAGYQFPLLVGLLGSGREEVGRHAGLVYGANTAGAIAGSLAGGFGLLPLMGAPGAWRLGGLLTAALAGTGLVLGLRREGARAPHLAAVPLLVLALGLAAATGPTSVWRHSGVGAGRLGPVDDAPNAWRELIHRTNASVLWHVEGRECDLAIRDSLGGLAFLTDGKNDGCAVDDAPTQVGSGLVGAALHPGPRRVLVVGLGTGSTAGWLADVPGLERVDVAELEPAVVEVARRCAPVNRNVLQNPRVRLLMADGREVLMTGTEPYDLVVSEPSRLHQAGVASLFTVEFYRAVRDRLAPGGLFLQWLPYYQVDEDSLRVAAASVAEVFPATELWEAKSRDLLLTCSREARTVDGPALRRRLDGEPFRSGLRVAWQAEGLEGLLSHFVGTSSFVAALAGQARGARNTDDRTVLEYTFARSVGLPSLHTVDELRRAAARLGQGRPTVSGGPVDWDLATEYGFAIATLTGEATPPREDSLAAAALVHSLFARGEKERLAALLAREPGPVLRTPMGRLARALAFAATGQEALANAAAAELAPNEARIARAVLHGCRGRALEAATALREAFLACRTDPWILPAVLDQALQLAEALSSAPEAAALLTEGLAEPFAVRLQEDRRRQVQLKHALRHQPRRALELLRSFEPWVPWDEDFLALRARAYAGARHPAAPRAADDLARFRSQRQPGIAELMLRDAGAGAP